MQLNQSSRLNAQLIQRLLPSRNLEHLFLIVHSQHSWSKACLLTSHFVIIIALCNTWRKSCRVALFVINPFKVSQFVIVPSNFEFFFNLLHWQLYLFINMNGTPFSWLTKIAYISFLYGIKNRNQENSCQSVRCLTFQSMLNLDSVV